MVQSGVIVSMDIPIDPMAPGTLFGDEFQDKTVIRPPGRAAMVLFIRLEGKGLELLASGSAPDQKIRAVARCFSIVGVFHATCKGFCRSFGGLFVMAYVKRQGDSLSNGQADDETKMVETASSQAKALGWTPHVAKFCLKGINQGDGRFSCR